MYTPTHMGIYQIDLTNIETKKGKIKQKIRPIFIIHHKFPYDTLPSRYICNMYVMMFLYNHIIYMYNLLVYKNKNKQKTKAKIMKNCLRKCIRKTNTKYYVFKFSVFFFVK